MFTLFVLLESTWNLLQHLCDISHLALGVLLHYLGKLKIQIFGHLSTVSVSRNSFLTPRFVQRFSGNSPANLFAVYPFKYKLFIKIVSSSLNTMLIVDKHCSDICCEEFSVHKLIAKVNKQKNSDVKHFICNQYGERHPIFKHRKYQNLWTNNKVRGV